jgi:hypothetical protein
MIRRALLAILGLALSITGLACFAYIFTAEPSFAPLSSVQKTLMGASPVMGMALGGVGQVAGTAFYEPGRAALIPCESVARNLTLCSLKFNAFIS